MTIQERIRRIHAAVSAASGSGFPPAFVFVGMEIRAAEQELGISSRDDGKPDPELLKEFEDKIAKMRIPPRTKESNAPPR